jgi:hypothetical protein
MEFRGPKFLHCLQLAVLLVILLLLPTCKSQEPSSSPLPSSWTFNIPGISFLSFSPTLTNSQNQRISLSFRTRNPNGLIFCHYLKDLDVKELDRINYRFCGELQYGLFVITYKLLEFEQSQIRVGKGKSFRHIIDQKLCMHAENLEWESVLSQYIYNA